LGCPKTLNIRNLPEINGASSADDRHAWRELSYLHEAKAKWIVEAIGQATGKEPRPRLSLLIIGAPTTADRHHRPQFAQGEGGTNGFLGARLFGVSWHENVNGDWRGILGEIRGDPFHVLLDECLYPHTKALGSEWAR
jgi:hypothetical protein